MANYHVVVVEMIIVCTRRVYNVL